MNFIAIDLNVESHRNAIVALMKHYMLDPMGGGKTMPADLPERMLNGLALQPNYKGFLVEQEGRFIALANCFVNFSTFRAMQLINIHDFVVDSECRNQGVGAFFLKAIANYAKNEGMCRVNLEVREDNFGAMHLYKKMGFRSCVPNMYFWEMQV